MECPVCEKEMEVHNVLMSPARQGDGDIVDEEWRDMYVCDGCQIYEPITKEDE